MSGNHLTGSIHNWLNTLTNLQILGLNYNRLTGSIPDLSALTNLQTLWLSDNQLTGSIPTSLTNLNTLNELDISYNQLTAQDPALLIFLSNKDSDWAQTQTIPPTNLQATPLSENSIEISWTPILYSGDGGYYRVKYATTTGGPYIPATTTTADKSATSYVVTDLSPNTAYYFVVETYTPAHDMQQNDLTSALSTEVSATTHQSSTTPPITPPVTPLPPITPTTPPATPLPPTMNLSIGFSGNGHGHITTNPSGIDCKSNQTKCSHPYETASWIKMIATAAADSKFTGWSGWQSDCDDGEVFMSGLRSCTANFQLLRFPLTVTTVGQGKISSEPVGINCGDKCQHVFDIGTNVTLVAIPETGWQFQKWNGDCDDKGLVVMTAAKQCQATFSPLSPPSNEFLTPTVKDTVPITTNPQTSLPLLITFIEGDKITPSSGETAQPSTSTIKSERQPASLFLGQAGNIDLENIHEVSTFVFSQLDNEVKVYPTENYLYYQFLAGEKSI